MKPMSVSEYPITVFYDGACGMCQKQVAALRGRDAHGRLVFVDSSVPNFDARAFGLQGEPLQKYIYVRTQSGEVARGADAFRRLWRATNRPLLAFLVGLPLVKQVGRAVYTLVSRLRYQLSGGRKEGVCDFHCAKEM